MAVVLGLCRRFGSIFATFRTQFEHDLDRFAEEFMPELLDARQIAFTYPLQDKTVRGDEIDIAGFCGISLSFGGFERAYPGVELLSGELLFKSGEAGIPEFVAHGFLYFGDNKR